MKALERILEKIVEGKHNINELLKLPFHPSTIYRNIKKLEQMGIIRIINKRIEVTERGRLIIKISRKYNVQLYRENFLKIIKLLIHPLEKVKTARLLNLTEKTVTNYLKILEERGLIKINKNVVLSDELKELSKLLNEEGFEEEIYWRFGNEKLIKTKKVLKDCSLTAFSKFNEFGIQIFTDKNYYYCPRKKLSKEEIFVHSLVFSRNLSELLLSLVFYLKEIDNFDGLKVEKLVRKYGVIKKYSKLKDLIRNPSKEVEEFLEQYGVKLPSFSSSEMIKEFFKKLDKELRRNIEIFLIGGAAMVINGLKPSTKDVDIIVKKKDLKILESALKRIGLKKNGLVFENNVRIDVFVERVMKGFGLTKSLLAKKKLFFEGKRLKVFLLSNEAIFLFKSLSERKRDFEDCLLLAKKGLDWNFILKEILEQERKYGKYFSFSLLDTILMLKEFGIKAPIEKKLDSHCLEIGILLALKNKKLTVKELSFILEKPEITVRRKIEKLVKQGNVKKIKVGKKYLYSLAQ